MARPPARELTERELEVMHVFWERGESTVADVRDILAAQGLDRAYTTVATLVRILADKRFLIQTNDERPFSYKPARSYEEVSRKLLGEMIDRVFRGSRELLLVRLMEQTKLTAKERVLAGRGPAAAAGEAAMNALGIMLVGSIAHATLFAIAGIAAYLALRRRGPAAGSLAAMTGLAVMAMVSIAALSPWPRWWTFGAVDPPSAAVGVGESRRRVRRGPDRRSQTRRVRHDPPLPRPGSSRNRPPSPRCSACSSTSCEVPAACGRRRDGAGANGSRPASSPASGWARPDWDSVSAGSHGCGRGAGRSRIAGSRN